MREAKHARQTLVLPVQLYYLAAFVAPADDARQPAAPPLTLWSADEVHKVLAAAGSLLLRCFEIKLDCKLLRSITLASIEDARLVDFAIAASGTWRDRMEVMHQAFETRILRARPPVAGNPSPRETHVLLVNKIYELNREEAGHPERSRTRGFALTAESDDPDEPSNRVIVGYVEDPLRRRPASATRLTRSLPQFFANTEIAGAVLAHEIGHSLGLEHNERKVSGKKNLPDKKNLMSKVIDEPPAGMAPPDAASDYAVEASDVEAAREAGLESKRLLRR